LGYKLLYDLHTHTTFSHGKGSIFDNVVSARNKGLKMIGIADHGPGHKLYGMNMKELPEMRRQIEEVRKMFPEIDIQLAAEANIVNESGILDIGKEDQKLFDYIIAGYHYGAFGDKPLKTIGVCLGGFVKFFSARTYNTDLVIKALHENDIKMLTHPGDKIDFDLDEISKACEQTHTIMEINNHHNGLSVEGIKIASKYDVEFVISSDAHKPCDVGNCDAALERARIAGLDFSRIKNIWS